MSSYDASQDVRIEELTSNVNPGQEVILNLIENIEEQGIAISDEAKRSFKIFSKSLETRRLKRIFQTRLAQYQAGEQSLQDIRMSNRDFKNKEDQKRRRRGEPPLKLLENKDNTMEGKVTIFCYQRNRYLVVRFDSLIKEELFVSSIVKYRFQNTDIVLLIPSFFNMINTAKELGIPRVKLGTVFGIFCKLAVPGLQGQMGSEISCLPGNLEKLLEVISIQGERTKLEQQLNQITRQPNSKLSDLVHLLFTLYNSSVTLEYLVDEKEENVDIDSIISDPSQVSKINKINETVHDLLHKAMRSLTSAECQKNISTLVRKKKAKMPHEVMREAIFRCDERHPLKSIVKLPPSLVFLSSHDSLDLNPPLQVLEASFGSFNIGPDSQSDNRSRPPRSPYNGRNRSPRRQFPSTPPGFRRLPTPPGFTRKSPSPRGASSPPKPQRNYDSSSGAGNKPQTQRFGPKSPTRTPPGFRRASPKPSFDNRGKPPNQSPSSNRYQKGFDSSRAYTPPRGFDSSRAREGNTPPKGRAPTPTPRATTPRASSNSPGIESRTPSPGKWRHPASSSLDNMTLENVIKNVGIHFCSKCGMDNHRHQNCFYYPDSIKSRCRICYLYHATGSCQQSSFLKKSRPFFRAKN